MRLFLYGTLLDPDLLSRLAGRHLPCTPATLHGWRRVAMPRGHSPTLRRGMGAVEGALASVDAATLTRLRTYEGQAYRLTPVVVRSAQGETVAHAWIAPGGTLRDWP